MPLHVAVQISLCILASEWRLVHADRTAQTWLVASLESVMSVNEVCWSTYLAMLELTSSFSLALSETEGVRSSVVEPGPKSGQPSVTRFSPSILFMLFTCNGLRYRLRSGWENTAVDDGCQHSSTDVE